MDSKSHPTTHEKHKNSVHRPGAYGRHPTRLSDNEGGISAGPWPAEETELSLEGPGLSLETVAASKNFFALIRMIKTCSSSKYTSSCLGRYMW